MELDDLKATWMENARAAVRINARALHSLTRAEGALQRHRYSVIVELCGNAMVLLLLGSFIARHGAEARFLVPALALHLGTIALTIACIRQLALIGAVDYGQPVLAIQRAVEQMRIEWIRTTKWTFVTAPLLWVPLLIVSMKGLLGLDAWAILDTGWLVANLAFGAALIPLLLLIARRYRGRLMDDLAGRSLTAARQSLQQLSRFEELEDGGRFF